MLEAIVSVCPLGANAPSAERLQALNQALRRRMRALDLTGAAAIAGDQMVMVCEGASDRIDDWLGFAGREPFRLLIRRAAPCRELSCWTLLDSDAASVELEWLRMELARPEPDGQAIGALLAWSARRQEGAAQAACGASSGQPN